MDINYPSLHDFIGGHLRYQQHWNKSSIGMKDAKWQELKKDTFIEQWVFKAGSMFKVFETTNFGWIVFHHTAKLANGSKPIKRIFKY